MALMEQTKHMLFSLEPISKQFSGNELFKDRNLKQIHVY